MLIDSLPKCSVTVDRCGNVFGPPEKYRRVEKFQSHPITKNESAWHWQCYIINFFSKLGHSRSLFFYFCLFSAHEILPMVGFELWTSGEQSERSTN